jgi:hypothetical protein
MSIKFCSISIFTPLESVVVQLLSLNFGFLIYSSFFSSIFKGRRHFHQAQRFGANIFKGPIHFHQAQWFGANIFKGRIHLHQAQRFSATSFKGRIHFHQAQRFGANIFKGRIFFLQAQRFGANILKVRLFFSPDANNFKERLGFHLFQACQDFFISTSKVKYARSKAKF